MAVVVPNLPTTLRSCQLGRISTIALAGYRSGIARCSAATLLKSRGIAVDARGDVYITGDTESRDLATQGAARITYSGSQTAAFAAKIATSARINQYKYDGLLRLIGADERPSSVYTYTYDMAGNRTSVQLNGGTLVKQIAGGTTTLYTQDLASPLSQILQTKVGSATPTDYVYGLNRLASLNGSTTTWYASDALDSVRRTFNSSATPLGIVKYDPWGTPLGYIAYADTRNSRQRK